LPASRLCTTFPQSRPRGFSELWPVRFTFPCLPSGGSFTRLFFSDQLFLPPFESGQARESSHAVSRKSVSNFLSTLATVCFRFFPGGPLHLRAYRLAYEIPALCPFSTTDFWEPALPWCPMFFPYFVARSPPTPLPRICSLIGLSNAS